MKTSRWKGCASPQCKNAFMVSLRAKRHLMSAPVPFDVDVTCRHYVDITLSHHMASRSHAAAGPRLAQSQPCWLPGNCKSSLAQDEKSEICRSGCEESSCPSAGLGRLKSDNYGSTCQTSQIGWPAAVLQLFKIMIALPFSTRRGATQRCHKISRSGWRGATGPQASCAMARMISVYTFACNLSPDRHHPPIWAIKSLVCKLSIQYSAGKQPQTIAQSPSGAAKWPSRHLFSSNLCQISAVTAGHPAPKQCMQLEITPNAVSPAQDILFAILFSASQYI